MPRRILFAEAAVLKSEQDIERITLELLRARDPGKTICPSEVARALTTRWRPEMDRVRAVVATMAERGLVEVTQKGVVVDIAHARGPLRIRLHRGKKNL